MSMTIAGIEQPIMANRFRVVPMTKIGAENFGSHFTNNVVNVKLDLLKGSMVLRVRQSVAVNTLRAINAVITKSACPPTIEMMDNGDEPVLTLSFCGEVVRHELVFDYAEGGVLVHEIEWKITAAQPSGKY